MRRESSEIALAARPLRVAFLIASNTEEAVLASYFSFCTRYWGGRYWIFIPTDGKEVDEDWFKLLRSYDPDIIYFTVKPTEELVVRINRSIQPSKIITSKDPPHHHEIEGITTDWIPQAMWAQRSPVNKMTFAFLSAEYDASKCDPFILQNFGVLDKNISTLHSFAEVPTDTINVGETSAIDFLRLLREKGMDLIVPRDLSSFQVTKPITIYSLDQHNGRHIVVGNSVHDRTYAWNRSLFDPWNKRMGTVWLPGGVLEKDSELLQEFVNYANARFFDQADGNGKNLIVSYSLTSEQLKPIAEMLSRKTHHHYGVLELDSTQFPKFTSAIKPYTQQTIQLDAIEHSAHFDLPVPKNLPSTSKGFWAVDIDLPDAASHADHVHPRPRLKIMRKLGVASSFFVSPSLDARVNRANSISLLANNSMGRRHFRFPKEWDYFFPLLRQVPYSKTQMRESSFKRGELSFFEQSDKGRSLYAMFQLFGGLTPTCQTLEEPLWRQVILQASGEVEENRATIEEKISKIFLEEQTKQGVGCPTSVILDGVQTKLSEFFFTRKRGMPKQEMSKEDMNTIFRKVKKEFKYSKGRYSGEEKFDDEYLDDLDLLVCKGVFLQGCTLRCRNCGTKTWYIIDALASSVSCQACASEFFVGPSPLWSFRLNALLRRGIAHEGVLAMIQALTFLTSSAHNGFVFVAGQTFYKYSSGNEPENPFAEVDILASVNGLLVLVEVKSRPNMVKEGDFEKLERLTNILEPDVVLVLASKNDEDDKWPDWLPFQLRKLKTDHPFVKCAVSIIMDWENLHSLRGAIFD